MKKPDLAAIAQRARNDHLIKSALAIAILTYERAPDRFTAYSDMDDMRDLLEAMAPTAAEREIYTRGATGPVTGNDNLIQFPRPSARTAQVVYDEMRGLAAELSKLTGRPVEFTAVSTDQAQFDPPGAA